MKNIQTIYSLNRISPKELKSKALWLDGPMNGGKTEEAIRYFYLGLEVGFRSKTYQHIFHVEREGAKLVVNMNRNHLPACLTGSVKEIKEDLFNFEGSDSFEFAGKRYKVNKKPDIAIIDEPGFYCLTQESAEELIALLNEGRKRGIGFILPGISKDFRKKDFVYTRRVMRECDYVQIVPALCKAIKDDKVCGNFAYNTQRIWTKDLVNEEGLMNNLNEYHINFIDKEGMLREGYSAPAFDLSVRPEKEKNPNFYYVPMCEECFPELPLEDLVSKAKNLAIAGQDFRKIIHDLNLIKKIEDYLKCDEKIELKNY